MGNKTQDSGQGHGGTSGAGGGDGFGEGEHGGFSDGGSQPFAARILQAAFMARETGKALLGDVTHRVRTVEEDLKARREVDVSGMIAGLKARLAEQLELSPLPVPADLSDRSAPFGLGRIQTWAWSAPKLRKIVVSHIHLPPVLEGLALTLLPVHELDFPCFAADLMALPWHISVNVDVYGRDWQTRDSLQSLRLPYQRLSNRSGPLWAARLGSGHGLHARLRPRQVEEGFAGLKEGVASYLKELEDAPPGRSIESQTQFFYAFHQNGPRVGPLKRVMGDEWAERYSRLVFE